MRKRAITHVAKTVFWYVLYFLPVLFYLIWIAGYSQNATSWEGVTFGAVFSELFAINQNNVIYSVLSDIFGTEGVFPIFGDTAMISFMTYYVGVYLLHLLVDFLMFIPKFAHNWMKEFVGD